MLAILLQDRVGQQKTWQIYMLSLLVQWFFFGSLKPKYYNSCEPSLFSVSLWEQCINGFLQTYYKSWFSVHLFCLGFSAIQFRPSFVFLSFFSVLAILLSKLGRLWKPKKVKQKLNKVLKVKKNCNNFVLAILLRNVGRLWNRTDLHRIVALTKPTLFCLDMWNISNEKI